MKNMYKLLFAVCAFVSSLSVNASHILGGEIEWECLPSGEYQFTLTIYRDCAGAFLSASTQVLQSNSPAGAITCTKKSTSYINNTCGAPPCNSVTTAYRGAIEQHVYQSNPITLAATPPASGWWFYWQSCCRPASADNLSSATQQGYTLRARMLPYTPPGDTIPMNASSCYDHSPKFLEFPNISYCSGMPETYFPLGADANLDSLHYDWATPLVNTGSVGAWQGVTWKSQSNPAFSYSDTVPLPTSVINPINQAANLDGPSGMINFTTVTQSSVGEGFVMCVKVSEYRSGQLIGEVYRDLPIFVKPCISQSGSCSGVVKNFAQDTLFGNTPNNTFTKVSSTSINSMSHYVRNKPAIPGENINFTLLALDYDLNANCSPEKIILKAFGTQMSQDSIYSANGPNAGVGPSASLNSLNSNGTFTSSLSNTVEFNWPITCALSDLKSARFYFLLANDNCPIATKKWVIVDVPLNVKSYLDAPKFDTNLSHVNGNGNIELFWNKPDTSHLFTGYVLWHSYGGGQPYILHQASGFVDTNYIHVNPPSGKNIYWVRAVGGCTNAADTVDVNTNQNGTIVFKTDIGIEEFDLQSSVYPQPMGDVVHFEGLPNNEPANIKVYSIDGALLLEQQVQPENQRATSQTSSLKTGVYIFEVTQKEKSGRFKLVKK